MLKEQYESDMNKVVSILEKMKEEIDMLKKENEDKEVEVVENVVEETEEESVETPQDEDAINKNLENVEETEEEDAVNKNLESVEEETVEENEDSEEEPVAPIEEKLTLNSLETKDSLREHIKDVFNF